MYQEITIVKSKGAFDFRTLLKVLSDMKDGEYTVTVEKSSKKRTNPQNSYLWGVVYPILRMGLVAEGWTFTSDEQIHEYCKQLFSDKTIFNEETGDLVRLPASTSKMNTEQFSAYVDSIVRFAYNELNITIPEPINSSEDVHNIQ